MTVHSGGSTSSGTEGSIVCSDLSGSMMHNIPAVTVVVVEPSGGLSEEASRCPLVMESRDSPCLCLSMLGLS